MTRELERPEWKLFFDKLSHALVDWETTVQVLNEGAGAQILSQGLPFNGITFEDKNGSDTIGILLGSGTANHQTHNIAQPVKVAFERQGTGPAGTLDIEDASMTKTLVTFVEPRRALMECASAEMVAFHIYQ